MATTTVRRFMISLDPDEAVDVTASVDEIGRTLADLGFEQVGAYTFRFSDPECLLKIELARSSDGFFVNAIVQAADEHEYRLAQVAEAFSAHIIDGNRRG
jgi:hypothetical protein